MIKKNRFALTFFLYKIKNNFAEANGNLSIILPMANREECSQKYR